MAEKKKQIIEYRYYEMPSGHYVLALLGQSWVRDYGVGIEDELHFHNFLEIGVCYWGEGVLRIEDKYIPYKPGDVTFIPANIPHNTISKNGELSKWEYLFVDLETFIRNEMSFRRLDTDSVIKNLRKSAYILGDNENAAEIANIKRIIEEYRNQPAHYRDAVKAYLSALVIGVTRVYEESNDEITKEYGRVNPSLRKGIAYIREHHAEEIKIEDVANYCGLSESHFRRLFEETMSMKPLDFVNMVRIEMACNLLQDTDISMDEVGFRVGYQTPSTFNRNFKKIAGTTPYIWKREHKNVDQTIKYSITAKKGW